MEIIEVRPPNKINFRIPNQQSERFTITNLTLRSICIYITCVHPLHLSIFPKSFILQAFQQKQVQAIIHWCQQLNVGVKSKLRIYIWQMYEDEPIEVILDKMFNKEEESCCLMFEELTVQLSTDHNSLQTIAEQQRISKYQIQRVALPNSYLILQTEEMINKLLQHCEKLGKVKAIYTFNKDYVVEFIDLPEPICSYFQIRDENQNMALYSVGIILSTGSVLNTPDMIILDQMQPSSKSSLRQKLSRKKASQENYTEEEKTTPLNLISSKLTKNIIKQSFMTTDSTLKRKRNRSQQKLRTFEEQTEFDYPISYIDVDNIKQIRNAIDYEYKIPKKKQYYETTIETTKIILNMITSQDQKTVYVLLRDCLMICPLDDLSAKKVIKFDALDEESVNLKTPMILSQNSIIFGNECYLYWLNLEKKSSEWKYVQRKEIYCLESIDDLGLVMVGGKNFSKLAYLGKSTSRTNIKVYTNGQKNKHTHLFTYDIPNCESSSIISLKYINTKPSNTKLLLIATDHGRLFFLRVKAFNQFQVYSQIQIQQIGIQNIISMEYHPVSASLVMLQKLADKSYCFKNLKLKCSYEKVEITTESVRLPVSNYKENFSIGGRQSNKSLVAIEKREQKLTVWKLPFQNKEPSKLQQSKTTRRCILAGENIIYQDKTSIKCNLLMND